MKKKTYFVDWNVWLNLDWEVVEFDFEKWVDPSTKPRLRSEETSRETVW